MLVWLSAVAVFPAEQIAVNSSYDQTPKQNRDIQERVEVSWIGDALDQEGGAVEEGRRHLTKRSPVNPFCPFCLTEATLETLQLGAKKTVKTLKLPLKKLKLAVKKPLKLAAALAPLKLAGPSTHC